MAYATPAKNPVTNGKPRSASDHVPITKPYRPPPNTYRHETRRLHRTLHHSHSIVHHSRELAVQDISIEPLAGYNVARRRPLRSWPRWPHPTTDPKKAYGLIIRIEAYYFGKNFLRMAGIVQMLHAHKPPYVKYPYAHTRTCPQARFSDQRRVGTCHQGGTPSSQAPTIP